MWIAESIIPDLHLAYKSTEVTRVYKINASNSNGKSLFFENAHYNDVLK